MANHETWYAAGRDSCGTRSSKVPGIPVVRGLRMRPRFRRCGVFDDSQDSCGAKSSEVSEIPAVRGPRICPSSRCCPRTSEVPEIPAVPGPRKRSRALACVVLGKRNYRDEVKPRLNRLGMALRELSAPFVPMRVPWGRERCGSAPMFISFPSGPWRCLMRYLLRIKLSNISSQAR